MEIFLHLILFTFVNCLQWELIQDQYGIVPSGREDAALGFSPKYQRAILFGGRADATILSDTWIYHFEKNSSNGWEKLSVGERMPEARHSMSYGMMNDEFYIYGGKGENDVIGDIWKFRLDRNEWTEVVTEKTNINKWSLENYQEFETKRYGSFSCSHHFNKSSHKNFIGFGRNIQFRKKLGEDVIEDDAYSSIVAFHPTGMNSGKWSLMFADYSSYNPMKPHARIYSSATSSSKSIMFYGGCLSGGSSGGPCPSNDAWIATIFNEKHLPKWKRISTCNIGVRERHIFGYMPKHLRQFYVSNEIKEEELDENDEGVLVLYGGSSKNNATIYTPTIRSDEIAVYDLKEKKWIWKLVKNSSHSESNPKSLIGAAYTSTHYGILIFGGYSIENVESSGRLWRLKGTWSSVRNALTSDRNSLLSCFFGDATLQLWQLHGICMFTSFLLLLPISVVLRLVENSNDFNKTQLIFIFHSISFLLIILGFILSILSVRSEHFHFLHSIIGIILTSTYIIIYFFSLYIFHLEKKIIKNLKKMKKLMKSSRLKQLNPAFSPVSNYEGGNLTTRQNENSFTSSQQFISNDTIPISNTIQSTSNNTNGRMRKNDECGIDDDFMEKLEDDIEYEERKRMNLDEKFHLHRYLMKAERVATSSILRPKSRKHEKNIKNIYENLLKNNRNEQQLFTTTSFSHQMNNNNNNNMNMTDMDSGDMSEDISPPSSIPSRRLLYAKRIQSCLLIPMITVGWVNTFLGLALATVTLIFCLIFLILLFIYIIFISIYIRRKNKFNKIMK
ncbi:hypothetical protein SNEBB_004432 [Seison nebaliae]|nr:hypothetical protein SNEBB_004432 [Seison nebaliae]